MRMGHGGTSLQNPILRHRAGRRGFLLSALAGLSMPAFGQDSKEDAPYYPIPIRLTSDRLWTTTEISTGEKYFTVLDSGGLTNKIATRLANDLKLKVDSSYSIQGLGGTERGSSVELEKPVIGDVYDPKSLWFVTTQTLDKQLFKLMLGSGMFMFANSEFDMQQAQWRLYKRGHGPDFTGYTKIEKSYQDEGVVRQIHVPCQIGPMSGKFHFDTGSPTNFLMDGRASASLKLWDTQQPYVPSRTGGFGRDRVSTRYYRMKSSTIAGFALDNAIISLSDPRRSNSIMEGVDGLLGLRAIRHFNFICDAKEKALWLKPNDINFGNEDQYPMSGLLLEQKDGAIFVEDVGIGSPAATAGIQAGDMIVGADGAALVNRLNGDAGEMITLEIERNGGRKATNFNLEPYL
jgi:hypothetical protein